MLPAALDWFFRNRTSGRIVIDQWPNPPLWLLGLIMHPSTGTVLGTTAGEAGNRIAVAPLVGYQVNTFSRDQVRENGTGPFNLTVAAQDFVSARSLVGGRPA